MHSNNIIRTISLIGTLVLAATTAWAVDPPPDGGYPGYNTAEGENALLNADTSQGIANTAVGYQALFYLTTGFGNTAIGWDCLFPNTTGVLNTGVGNGVFENSTTGSYNAANGAYALAGNTTGSTNTADGFDALQYNTSGNKNTASGARALLNNSTGSFNIGIGNEAGANLTTGSNNIDIGNVGVAGDSGVVRIGGKVTQRATYIAGINGITVAGGVGVLIDTNGRLGTVVSSERFKDAIRPMDKTSEAILALKPVTFRYKHDLDPDGIPQFGLVAEQVEKVNPDLVARDEAGKPYTVRYEAVNAMLLNEFLKEHRKVEEQAHTNQEQDATITELKATVAQLQSALRAQAAQIQKVSDQLSTQSLAPRVVAND